MKKLEEENEELQKETNFLQNEVTFFNVKNKCF